MKLLRKLALVVAVLLSSMGVMLLIALPAQADIINETAKFVASDGAEGEDFGYSVALSGDRAVVGAPYDDDNGPESGSVYVFERVGGVWLEQAKLVPSDGAEGDQFGISVALSGGRAVVGANQNDTRGFDAGSAYVFERVGGVWIQQAQLSPVDPTSGPSGDQFGFSVALSGDTVIVGAWRDDSASPIRGGTGAAYVFQRVGDVWVQQGDRLQPSDIADSVPGFGYSVAISGDTAVVGNNSANTGAAYVFERVGGVWSEQAALLPADGATDSTLGPGSNGRFGISVAVSGDTAVVGASGDDEFGTRSGSAYIFDRVGGIWAEQGRLLPSGGKSYDEFGISVALSGDTAVVGAWRMESSAGAGSANMFQRVAGVWVERATLLASDGVEECTISDCDGPVAIYHTWGDRFGVSVALSGDNALVGANRDDDNGTDSGSVYVFAKKSTPLTSLVSLPDINANGFADIAVAVEGVNFHVQIRDGSTDALLTDIDFGEDPALDVVVLPDLDASGDPEIAVLGQRPSGQIRVQVKDSATGVAVSNLFYGSQYSGVDMALVSDYGGGGLPELAVLGVNAGNGIRVQTRDIATDTFLDNLFLGSQTTAKGVVSVSDVSGNGLPEIGMLSVVNASSQARLQVLDADTGVFYTNVWYGNIYTPVELITMPTINGGSAEEFVGLGINEVTGGVRVQIRDSGTAAILTNMFLGSANVPVDLAVVADNNGNGFPEIAVLMETPAGNGIVKVHDSNTGLFIRNVFFNGLIDPVGIVTLPNYAGGPGDEIAVLGTNGGVKRVQIKDSGTNAQINAISFPEP